MIRPALLVWNEDRATAEAALPPGPEALQLLRTLRAFHKAEVARKDARSPEEEDALCVSALAAQADLTRQLAHFCEVSTATA